MKKLKVLLISLFSLFMSTSIVHATCDTTESNKIRSEAVNVKANYEKVEGILDESEYNPPDGLTDEELEQFVAKYNYFKIYITNLTENLYVKVYNDVTKETKTYHYADSDQGTISFDWTNLKSIAKFRIDVYSSNKTGCPDTKLFTLYQTTPRFNTYSGYSMCDDAKDFYLCHDYLTVDPVEFDKFVELVTKYKNGQIKENGEENGKPKEKEKGFFQEYKTQIIIGSILVICAGGLTVVIIVTKQRSKKNEK